MRLYKLFLVLFTLYFYAINCQTPPANDDTATALRNGAAINIMVLSNISFGGDGPNTDHPLTFNNGSKNNANDENISLMNDEFHTLTIDWREDQVDYFIDGVLQESFDTNVAMGMSEVIIGFRQLTWAGDFNWTGDHTLVIDYFKIEALNALSTQENQLS